MLIDWTDPEIARADDVLIRRLTVPHIAHRARGNLACVVVPCGADASSLVARLVRLGVAAMVSRRWCRPCRFRVWRVRRSIRCCGPVIV